ncbi:hypothetical protein ACQEVF_25125 [Nonomuraea polychroma]|uniref:hypothetical protein n=1 Tax=Nonomuraea polychroma TaxID=46176 RepID=UPI003D8A0F4A
MTRVEPNPYSPYANADPDVRHLFAVPSWLMASPRPGTLTPTSCGALAVVPEAPIKITPGDPLPEGVCGACARAHAADTVVARTGPLTDCQECGLGTTHGAICAMCRGDLHEAWWLVKNTANAECACSESGPCPAHAESGGRSR